MDSNDRFEAGGAGSIEEQLPESWADTPRDPRYLEGSVGTCRTGQGTMLYDRDAPGRYLIGPGVDLEEMA
ncbi:hypothetical protein [Natronomonas marina]|jgi:hypothetical protein|uniref:hypothetical protein n=1 Tax=Natronomonas marina TaxID=2961939 RepID=UPI0020CA05F0|nr:hypothetical protein [Natronomonas marina]